MLLDTAPIILFNLIAWAREMTYLTPVSVRLRPLPPVAPPFLTTSRGGGGHLGEGPLQCGAEDGGGSTRHAVVEAASLPRDRKKVVFAKSPVSVGVS